MVKAAVMFVAVAYGGGGAHNFTIPGYENLDACKASQSGVTRQLMTEPFVFDGREGSKRSLPQQVSTKCVEL